jgi:hypothetical protein
MQQIRGFFLRHQDFLMAQSWRKPLCAVMTVRLSKSMAHFKCAISFFPRRTNGAWRKKRGHNQLAPLPPSAA